MADLALSLGQTWARQDNTILIKFSAEFDINVTSFLIAFNFYLNIASLTPIIMYKHLIVNHYLLFKSVLIFIISF